MTDRSRRAFLKTAAVGSAVTGGALLLPAGLARASAAPPPLPQTRSTTYRLRVTNNSTAFEQFALYQNDPDLGVYDVMSLAWFVKGANPQQTLVFQWTTDFSFMLFGNGGTTQPTQTVAADPADLNHDRVDLTYAAGAFALQQGPVLGTPRLGSLYIRELSTVPLNSTANVGIGMSGAALYATPVEPNVELMFTPHPATHFWITAGDFEAGQSLDVESITGTAAIDFAPGTYDLHATLNRDYTWTVAVDTSA